MSTYPESSRRPFYRAPGMPLQRFLACPRRNDGHTADGMPGDCYRTALAGALGLPRDAVPHFVAITELRSEWWWEVQRWTAAQYGRNLYGWAPDVWRQHRADDTATLYPGDRHYLVASGPSPRGHFHHSIVVDLDLEPVHDPHPLGMGLSRIDLVEVLLPMDWTPPARTAIEGPR